MTKVIGWVQTLAKVAEWVGALVAVVAGIIAKGDLSSSAGRVTVLAAVVTAIGHATTHTTEGTT